MVNRLRLGPRLLLLLPIAVAACGDDAEPLTCEAIQSSDFCWSDSVAEAVACVDLPDSRGQLNADRTACSYEEGPTVRFEEPLPNEVSGESLWRFSVERDGETCASFAESDSSQSLETAAGLLEVTADGFSLTVSCPDGTRYRSENPLELLDCEGGLTGLPGAIKSSGGTTVTFGFTGAGDDGRLWSCESAE